MLVKHGMSVCLSICLFAYSLSYCQGLHKALEDMRPQVGEIHDQLRTLQNKGCCCERPGQTSPRSLLLTRWQNLHKQLERNIQSTKTIRKNYERCWKDHAQITTNDKKRNNVILLEELNGIPQ